MKNENATSFELHGFVVIKHLLPKELIETARECVLNYATDSTFNEIDHGKHFLTDRKDQGVLYDSYFKFPAVRKLLESEVLIDLFEDVLGDGVILYESSIVYKPEGTHNEVPFHQDFMNRGGERKLIVWVALDEVTVSNGALKVVPGSHHEGYRDFVKIKGETHHTRLRGWELFNEGSHFVEMNKGDVLVFDARLIHGSDRVDVTSTRFAARFAVTSMAENNLPRCVPVILSSDKNLFSSKTKSRVTPESMLKRLKRRMRKYVINNFPV